MSAPSPRSPSTWRALLCAAVLFLVGDVLVFRSGLYGLLAKPESSAGWVVRRTLLAPPPAAAGDVASVLLLGDSRLTEGCDEQQLRQLLGEPPVAVSMGAIPGSSPRVWAEVMPRIPAPDGGWSLVVVGLAEFDDDGGDEPQAERSLDLSFLGPWLTLANAAELAAELAPAAPSNVLRDVWLCAFCRSYAWRRDVQDLCLDPWTRYREVRRQFGRRRWGGGYDGVDRALSVRCENGTIVGLAADNRQDLDTLQRLVSRDPRVDNTAYRRRWLGALADRVTASGAQLVIVRMPSQVLPRGKPRVPNTRVLEELAQRPGVYVLPFESFADLEAPAYFFDALHLNRTGRRLFTPQLAAILRARFARQLRRPA